MSLKLSLEDERDIGSRMISEGLLRVERRREKKLNNLVRCIINHLPFGYRQALCHYFK